MKDWDNLIRYGKLGLQNGFDYYYLRMRLGVSYFEQNNYRKAISHFRKALEFNDKDIFALEYLYYSYLFSGRISEARALISNFPLSLSSRLQIKNKSRTQSLSLYNTYRFNPDYDFQINRFTLPEDLTVDGWQLIEKNLDYFNVQFEHQLGRNIIFYHGYGYLTKQRYMYVKSNSNDITYSNDRFHQYQIFFSGNFLVSNNFNIKLTLHYLNLRPKTYFQSTASPGPLTNSSYSTVSPENNLAGYLTSNLELGLFSFDLGAGYSGLNDQTQFQQDFVMRIFPLGNLNLYSATKISHQNNYDQSNLVNDHFIFNQLFGFRVFNHLWVELNGTFGEVSNYQDLGGTVIYNDVNPINYKLGLAFIIPLTNRGVELMVLYNYMETESLFFTYNNEFIENNNAIKHTIHSITGGIKWNISKN